MWQIVAGQQGLPKRDKIIADRFAGILAKNAKNAAQKKGGFSTA
jgi:hypothetical protein